MIRRPTGVLAVAVALGFAGCQIERAAPARGATDAIDPSVTLMPPQGATRVIDFTTDEGTGVSLDVAPDGRSIVFDLLGELYRLPIGGGEATPLTANSGLALNFHPAISPDGRRIAFISDRQGQNNVWTIDADGKHPRPVLLDRETRFMRPAWAPDGASLVAVRVFPTPGRGWHRQTSELWRLPLDGSAPTRLLGARLMHYDAPAFSPDGRYLYYHISYSTGDGLGLLTAGHRLQRLELATGKVENVRTTEPTELSPAFIAALKLTAYSADNPVDPPAALSPAVSPDGRRVAFGLERKGEPMVYRGHTYEPRTSVAVRDLATGRETIVLDTASKDLTMVNAQYGYGSFPRLAWTPDGRSIIAIAGGKLRRVDVATGRATVIPFTARVHRVLSEMTRNRLTIDDSAFTVKFIQWPVGSPDGRRLAFVAVGKIWMMDLPGGKPVPLTAEMRPTLQLTPSWSPDGRRIAYATWDDSARGQVWVVAASGGSPQQVSREAGEYLYPVWTPDGASIVLSRGPGGRNDGPWNGWNAYSGWTAVRIPADGGSAVTVASLGGPHQTSFGRDGRLYFEYRDRPDQAPGLLYYPFPTPAAESLVTRVRSVDVNGAGSVGEPRDHVSFPARREETTRPMLSPTGRWVAFQSDRFVHVAPMPPPAGGMGGAPPMMNANPNDSAPGRVRVTDRGGTYQTWRDSAVLQFASGNRYVTYDAATGRTASVGVTLRVPRPVPSGSIALVNATVITVDADRVIERGAVVVRGSRIACVGAAGACDTTGVSRVIDLSGKTVIPGLIDMHAHHTDDRGGVITPHRPSSALDVAYGVTTILDPATTSESLFPLADLIEAGVMVGPRTFGTAEVVISPGIAWGNQHLIRTQADADREVDRRADWGAVSIKNFRQSARYQQQLLIAAARRRHVSITGEGGPLYFDVSVVLDGQTGWEHLLADLPVFKDATTFFGKAGIVYSPTSIVAGHVLGSMAWFRPQQHLEADAKYTRFMPASELRRRLAGAQPVPKSTFSFPIIAEGLADIIRAGGHGVLGEHGEQFGIGTHWEIWAYAEALRPLEVLRVATLDGAFSLGLDAQLGSVTAGKIADLVVLNASPLRDIRNTADIAMVMKAGRLYDANMLDELWPARRAYGPIPWR